MPPAPLPRPPTFTPRHRITRRTRKRTLCISSMHPQWRQRKQSETSPNEHIATMHEAPITNRKASAQGDAMRAKERQGSDTRRRTCSCCTLMEFAVNDAICDCVQNKIYESASHQRSASWCGLFQTESSSKSCVRGGVGSGVEGRVWRLFSFPLSACCRWATSLRCRHAVCSPRATHVLCIARHCCCRGYANAAPPSACALSLTPRRFIACIVSNDGFASIGEFVECRGNSSIDVEVGVCFARSLGPRPRRHR